MGSEKKTTPASRQLRITLNAWENIDEIAYYIGVIKKEPLNAIKIGDAIIEMIGHVGENPFVYKECEELVTKTKIYRRAVCLSWLIIYKITPTEIIILGVIYGSRQPYYIKKLRNIK